MEPMIWSKNPERVTSDGILIPEQNYRNYKALEKMMPEFQKFVDKSSQSVDNPAILTNPVICLLAGVIFGALIMEVVR